MDCGGLVAWHAWETWRRRRGCSAVRRASVPRRTVVVASIASTASGARLPMREPLPYLDVVFARARYRLPRPPARPLCQTTKHSGGQSRVCRDCGRQHVKWAIEQVYGDGSAGCAGCAELCSPQTQRHSQRAPEPRKERRQRRQRSQSRRRSNDGTVHAKAVVAAQHDAAKTPPRLHAKAGMRLRCRRRGRNGSRDEICVEPTRLLERSRARSLPSTSSGRPGGTRRLSAISVGPASLPQAGPPRIKCNAASSSRGLGLAARASLHQATVQDVLLIAPALDTGPVVSSPLTPLGMACHCRFAAPCARCASPPSGAANANARAAD